MWSRQQKLSFFLAMLCYQCAVHHYQPQLNQSPVRGRRSSAKVGWYMHTNLSRDTVDIKLTKCLRVWYQLRPLRTVRRSLTTDAAMTLVHALISSRVDYCNSVLYGMCEYHLSSTSVGSKCSGVTHYWQTKVWSYCQYHAWRPPLAASEITYIVQTVLTGQ